MTSKILTLFICVAGASVTILDTLDHGEAMIYPSASIFQACHADHDYHREILGTYLTDSEFSADRITHGTNGITMPQIQLIQDTDSECALLDSVFASSLAMTYSGLSDKLYKFSYYKAGSYLFVSRSIAQSSDPDRYASGVSTFDVFSSAGVHMQGYAF